MALKSRLTQLKSKAKAATVEDDQEDEVVTTKAPVKKLGGLKGLKTKAAPEPEEDLDDEDLDDDSEDDEDEVVAKPVVKKTLGKAKAKPAPVEDDEDLDDDQDDDSEDEVVAKAAPKKTLGKKASTKSEEPAAKKTLFNGKAPKKERVLEENSILTREELASRLAAKADTTLVDAREMFSAVEDVLLEAIQKYQLNFMGVRFKRRLQAQRDHSGVGGIDLGESNFKAELVTRVFPHYVSTLRVVCDRQVAKGIMRDEEFVEGNFDDKGNFIEGTWHTPEGTKTPVFTPSTPRAGKVVKKGKK